MEFQTCSCRQREASATPIKFTDSGLPATQCARCGSWQVQNPVRDVAMLRRAISLFQQPGMVATLNQCAIFT